MTILFINPSTQASTQHPLITEAMVSSPPLGLGYIAAYLRQQHPDASVQIIDEAVSPDFDDELNAALKNPELTIVGISCLTATYQRSVDLAARVKEIKPDTLILFGGAHPSALPEESLLSGYVDIVVRKEGELTVCSLYDAVKTKKPFDDIPGISFLRGETIIHNPDQELIDLHLLPAFPYDLFERYITHYTDLGFISSSRGCPYDCIFCANRIVTGRRYRTFDYQYVVTQVETIVRTYGQKSIFFLDDNFGVQKEHFNNLINALIEKGLHKEAVFTTQMRGENLTQEVIDQLLKANFQMVTCGVETASKRLLQIINKQENLDSILTGIERASQNGLLTSTTFIYGLPTETAKDRSDSAKLSRRLPLDSTRFNVAIPYPGTRFYDIAKENGHLDIAPGWTNFNVQYYVFGDNIPFVPEGTDRMTLIFDTMWANIRFYMRWKILRNAFTKTNATGGGVISTKDKKSIRLYLRMFRLFLFLFSRFIYVCFKAAGERVLRRS